MAATFYLELVSPHSIFFSGNAQQIILPTMDGLRGVLAGHEPMVTAITAGEVRFLADGQWRTAIVSDSSIEVMPEWVILLAATIERPEEIDINRAQAAKRRAEEQLRQKLSQQEYHQTQAALGRALARLQSQGKKDLL